MDANRLVELARDCGMFVTTEMRWQAERWERLAAAVTDEIATPAIAAEREACAKICEETGEQPSSLWEEPGCWIQASETCAFAIRMRSNAEVRGDAPLYGAASLSTDGLCNGG